MKILLRYFRSHDKLAWSNFTYQTEFEVFANQTEGLNESFMISCFVGVCVCLKKDTRLSVQMLKPYNLADAICLASLQEEKVMARRRTCRSDLDRTKTNYYLPKSSTPPIK